MCSDWHGAVTDSSGKLTESAVDAIQQRVHEFVLDIPRDELSKKGTLTQPNKASKEYARDNKESIVFEIRDDGPVLLRTAQAHRLRAHQGTRGKCARLERKNCSGNSK